MVRLKYSIFHIPVNREGLIYFPSGCRSLIRIEACSDEGHLLMSEWAPLQGIHSRTLDEVCQIIERAQVLDISLNYLASCSDEMLEHYFRSLPEPLGFIVSLLVFQLQAHDDDGLKHPQLSRLILPIHTMEEIRKFVNEGHRCLKIKCGDDVEFDIQRLRNIREIVGYDVLLRIDLNKKLSFSDAVIFLKLLRDLKIEYVEEPIYEVDKLAKLIGHTGCALALDESYLPDDDIQNILDHKAKYLIIKASRYNNIYAVMNLCRAARQNAIIPIFSPCFESEFYALLMLKIIKKLGLFEHAHGVFVPIYLNNEASCFL